MDERGAHVVVILGMRGGVLVLFWTSMGMMRDSEIEGMQWLSAAKIAAGAIKQLLFCKCRDEQAGHLAFMFR